MKLKVNREIRAPKVRLISEDSEQLGIVSIFEALAKAQELGLDLVEISPAADPPVCKIIDYGKLKYQQTKRERENKKSAHQVKIKEVKLKPNIDTHDLEVKMRHAREFVEKGCKVKFTCMFRGREIVFADQGKNVLNKVCEELQDIAIIEAPPKMLGRTLSMMLAPAVKEKTQKQKEKKSAQGEDTQITG